MPPQKPTNVSLRLAPFAKTDLDALVALVDGEGQGCKQPDVVGALVARAKAAVATQKELDLLVDDVKTYRKKAKPLGY
jgi:hypothetical protein